ncbi:hypothetical protein HDU98_001331, partial [Podochytrium sp. JEL0797]
MRFVDLITLLAVPALAQLGIYEPADGKILFGAWIDTEDPKAAGNIGLGGDSPTLFNQRLGLNAPVFHMSQQLPLQISPFTQQQMTANLTMLEQTNTDAILLLTIYPNQAAANAYDLYTDADIQLLATQLDNISNPAKSGRRVMVRFAPEMNGNWFGYGQQPKRFVTEFQRIVTAVRAVTKRVAFVWAPNAANHYPFGGPLPQADLVTLDTNKDGAFDINDDPFTPYWPGADFVDWVGISLYWKGDPATGYPTHDNSVSPSDYFVQMVQGGGTAGANPMFPFYTMFAKKYNKPMMMPEGGSAYALYQTPSTTLLPAGAGQVSVEQSFWRTYLNTAFFTQFPKAKMFINFEYQKINEDSIAGQNNGITRDYRITWDPATRTAFKSDIAALGNTLQWAGPFIPGQDPLFIGSNSTAPPAPSAPAGSATAVVTTKSSASGIVFCGLAVVSSKGNRFDTPYEDIHKDLVTKDRILYAQNGLLMMLERNMATKRSPESWQLSREIFNVIFTCEERCYDAVLE